MRIWIDDRRCPPDDGKKWTCYQEINPALRFITKNIHLISVIDLDHDAGEFRRPYDNADYIVILKELERLERRGKISCKHIQFRIHSMNPVGIQNMRAIIQANNWKEVF